MTDDNTGVSISRRQTLATLGTVGAAGALGGAATNALLWDEEKFGNATNPNVLQAGELDLKVDWDVRYYDGRGSTPEQIAHSELTDQPGPILDLRDIKPGDVLETTLSAHVFDNPAFLGWHYQEHADEDNGITEPEDKVDGHDPNDSDGDPFAAGLAPLASGLLGSALGGRVFDDPDTDPNSTGTASDDGGFVSRKNLLRAATTSAAAGIGAAAFSGDAAADIGDILASGTMPNTGCCGAGLTFDGEYVYAVSGFDEPTVNVYEPFTGGTATQVATKTLDEPIDVIEWDPNREKFWGVGVRTDPRYEFYLFDLGDPIVTNTSAITGELQFSNSVESDTLIDGLAYDGSTDTIWFSPDGPPRVYQFNPDGTQTSGSPIVPELNEAGDQFDHISGVAVGAPLDGRPTLYLGNNPSGSNGDIVRVYADDGTFISGFAEETGFRVEDMACDPVTFAPSETLVVRDNTDLYKIYEVEQGTCPVAGQPEPDEGDGELDDVMQCIVWYDDGNNIPEEIWEGETELGDLGPEESLDETTQDQFVSEVRSAQSPDDIVDTGATLFAGTLADMDGADVTFKSDDSVAGEPADGDPSEEPDFSGTDGTWCYMNSTTEYVGVLCWVPEDIPEVNDNVIQSDRLEFQFGFDAIQCRHNVAGDGTPVDGTIDEADAENNANTP